MDALEELINAGPEPSYRVKSVVLLRYQDILKARQLMRKWHDITVALGFEPGQWRHIAASFRRVDAGVKAGKLTPGKPAPAAGVGSGFRATHGSTGNQQAGQKPQDKPVSKSGIMSDVKGVINLDDPANQL